MMHLCKPSIVCVPDQVDCRTPLLNCCRGVDDPRGAITHLVEMISAMRAILGETAAPSSRCW